MAKLLAPVVSGPVLTTSTHVQVAGALAGATVTVLANGTPSGSATASANGALLVPLTASLAAGAGVTARQSLGAETSSVSNQTVTVIDVPDPLPAPVFASPVSEFMSHVLLAGLVPGAKVDVRAGATLVGQSVSSAVASWVSVDPTLLNAGMILAAVQHAGGRSSLESLSPPLASVSARTVPTPVIGQPLHACDTVVFVSGMIPAAELELFNSATQRWTNIADHYFATGAAPLQPGPLKARQRLPGAGTESPEAVVTVLPAQVPPAPTVQPWCPEARRVTVSGLRVGATVTLASRAVGTTDEMEIGVFGAGQAVEQIDLPNIIGGTGPIMAIVARQTSCGLTSAPGSGLEFARPGSGAVAPQEPRIVEPLYDCAREVSCEHLLNGVLTQLVSARTSQPLSDLVVVTNPSARIKTWFPLVAGDVVEVRQFGCDAPARSRPERVRDLPHPMPVPEVVAPVRPGTMSVTAANCLAGATVTLMLDGVEIAMTHESWGGTAVFHLGKPLNEGQRLWAYQKLCQSSSPREGRGVVVTKGNLSVQVTPNSAAAGVAATFRVEARDTATGAAVAGLPVILGGAVVGSTGSDFAWTPTGSGTSVQGTVEGGSIYSSAGFSIELRHAVPLALNLFPGPVVIPNQIHHTDVEWTVTPDWGAAPIKLKANSGIVQIPPSPAPGGKVSVEVSFKALFAADVIVPGLPPETIPLAKHIAVVAMVNPSHALSARFVAEARDVAIYNENGEYLLTETRRWIDAQLFSLI